MTREEAKDFAKHGLVFRQSQIPFLKHIDKIYDYFESRTCKNCIYYNDELCHNLRSPLCAEFVSKDYGCNLWESK